MWQKLMALALAGAAGTLARYAVSGWAQRAAGDGFPWGTLAVNVAGCFLAGAVWSVAETRADISPALRSVVLIGFMGAFTTFSAFALESANLLSDGQWMYALGNVAVQNITGLAMVMAGLRVGRVI